MGKQMKVIFEIYHQTNKSYAKFFIPHQDFLYWQLSLEYLGGHILYRYDGQIEKLKESLIDCGDPEDDMKIIRLDLVSNSSEKYDDSHYIDNLAYEDYDWAIRVSTKHFCMKLQIMNIKAIMTATRKDITNMNTILIELF
jgi:hypothetical protein